MQLKGVVKIKASTSLNLSETSGSYQAVTLRLVKSLVAANFRKTQARKACQELPPILRFFLVLFNPYHPLPMKLLTQPLERLLTRFRYPISMPEEVAADLGLNISNSLTFKEFITCLTSPCYRPTKLIRFMPREKAEGIFQTALRKERFKQNSLFSYHFNGGWMEFVLQFDEQSRLRRIYIQHKDLKQKYEIPISQ